jgi:uncharacterized membrane protein
VFFDLAAASSAVDTTAKHLISPNIHVIAVHFPLGVFVLGLILEVLGLLLWRRSTARVAAKWMILLGGLLAIPAAMSGVDAYEDVRDHTKHAVKTDEGATIQVAGLSDTQFEPMRRHILWTGIGAGLAALMVTVYLGMSDLWRRRAYAPILLALLAAAFMMSYGAHWGGEGIYLQGVAVQMKYATATGFEWWVPARSTHILFAGLAMAVSLGALGATLRMLAMQRVVIRDEQADEELAALTNDPQTTFQTPPPAPRRVTDDMSMARTLNADAAIPPARTPVGRFWFLGALLFVAALGLGVWYQISLKSPEFDMSTASAKTVFAEMTKAATHSSKVAENRIGVHIVLGIFLAILPLLLAVVARFMSRARAVVAVLCLFMILLIGAEIWIGVLLSVRGAEGPIYKFPRVESPTSETV